MARPSRSLRRFGPPVGLLAIAAASLGLVGLLPEAALLPSLLMQLGLGMIAAGCGAGGALSLRSQASSGHSFPPPELPRVLRRLCPACGWLGAGASLEPVAEATPCGHCARVFSGDSWRRDSPQPLFAFLVALVATGAGLFVLGSLGSGPHGIDALTEDMLPSSLAAMAVGMVALSWVWLSQVAHASRLGTIAYVAREFAEASEQGAVARVDHDGQIVSASGKSRRRSAKRFVPPLSLAPDEETIRRLRAMRKLAAHERIALRTWHCVSWQRSREGSTGTTDYRSRATPEWVTEESDVPYVFASLTTAEPDASDGDWHRSIGLTPDGSSPLVDYLAWLERNPSASAALVDGAAQIEAREESAYAEAASDAQTALLRRRSPRR